MSKDNPVPTESTALARLDPQALLVLAVQNGAGIETMERLVALAKTVREQDAKEAWHRAIARFQAECPPIFKTKAKTGGAYSYTYAPLTEIMEKIQPVMGQLGLSVSWRRRQENGFVYSLCRVSHEMGHYEDSGEVGIPIASPQAGAPPAQQVGIAMSYADRYAIKGILGIAPQDDEDGAVAGDRKPTVEMPRRASEAQPETAQPTPQAKEPEPAGGRIISDAQRKRLWAIAYGAGKDLDLDKQDVTDKVHAILAKYKMDSTDDVTMGRYDSIIKELEEWGAGG